MNQRQAFAVKGRAVAAGYGANVHYDDVYIGPGNLTPAAYRGRRDYYVSAWRPDGQGVGLTITDPDWSPSAPAQ